MKYVFLIIISAAVGSLITVGLWPEPTPSPAVESIEVTEQPVISPDPYEGWKTIEVASILEAKIPSHCLGDGAAGSHYIICPEPENDQPLPEMVISSDGESFRIHRWENLESPYYNDILKSIRVLAPLDHKINIEIDW